MRTSINRTGQQASVTAARRNRRARKFLAMAVAALLVASGLLQRAQAADGDLDPTFDTDGKVTTDFFGSVDSAFAMAIQADGKIVAAGVAFTQGGKGENDFALARYNPDGSLDPTFGIGGKVTTDFFGSSDAVLAIALSPDGKIVAAGHSFNDVTFQDFTLARYNPDGSLDATFGIGGKVTTHVGDIDILWDLAIQADGKIVAVGETGDGSLIFLDFAVLRYNADGSLDPTFGSGGVVMTTDFPGIFAIPYAVVIQGDGRIVAAGESDESANSFRQDFALARYNPDGSPDPTFGVGGKVTTDFFGGSDDRGRDLVLQGDGRLVVAGSSSPISASNSQTNFALARYNTDGSPDLAFGAGGKVITDFAAQGDFANALAIQGDGRLVAAGEASVAGVSFDGFALARYNTDGSLDMTFGLNGKVITNFFGHSDVATDVAIQADGRIVAAGGTGTNLSFDFALARYLNTAVMAYNICLQDEDTQDTLQFNSTTGDYLFTRCGPGGFTLSGRGTIRRRGCLLALADFARNHRVEATVNTCPRWGKASVQVYSLGRTFMIRDRDIANNTCVCR